MEQEKKSPSNSTLMGLRGKPSSQIKLGSNVWTSNSNSGYLALWGEKKSMRAATEWTREGQQVAVNLERKRVIIHLEKGSKSVCHSPGSTKLSQAPAGGGENGGSTSVESADKAQPYTHGSDRDWRTVPTRQAASPSCEVFKK